MKKLSLIEFGPIDANEPDPDFKNKYVEEENFHILVDDKYRLITGEKGSGKSALIRGLLEKHKNNFTEKINLDFSRDFEYLPIANNLLKISETIDFSTLSLMKKYWEYTILIEVMKKIIADKNFQLTIDETRIFEFLKKYKYINDTTFQRLLSISKEIWKMIKFGTDDQLPNNLNDNFPEKHDPDILNKLHLYPLETPEFIEIKKIFSEYLKNNNKKVLLTLDGLDVLKVTNISEQEKINIIFSGLVSGVYNLSIDKLFYKTVIVKALIPHDRWLGLDNIRDKDKYDKKRKKISWTYKNLQVFLKKRIELSLDLDYTLTFDKAFGEIFPKNTPNEYIGIKENTFEYYLRHTFYRPRHLQIHFEKLQEDYPDKIITTEMISEVLEESSEAIVGYILEEYKVDHSRLDEFIRSFRNKSNIWRYGDLYSFVQKILSTMNIDYDPAKKIDSLYQIGFFGTKTNINHHAKKEKYYRYRPPLKNKKIIPYQCNFQYIKPETHITHGASDDMEFVIHPLFVEYCQLIPSKDFIIG